MPRVTTRKALTVCLRRILICDYSDGLDGKQDWQDGAVLRSNIMAQNHVRAIVISETSEQDLSTSLRTSATSTAIKQPSPTLARQ